MELWKLYRNPVSPRRKTGPSLPLSLASPKNYYYRRGNRSGITNDPNRPDDKEYILRVIGQVFTVSMETVKIVNALPDLGLPKEDS
jgi:hypothetical protein